MAINFQPLDNSGYVLQSRNQRLGRTIHRYLLEDNTTDRTVQTAAQALTNLTEQNPNLVPIYSLQNLDQRIRQNKYLVINGSAISLSNETKAADVFQTRTMDAYFSEAPLRDPVTCEKGHAFEQEHIQFWIEARGDTCPYQEDHAVGNIEIDDEILENVQRARNLHNRDQANSVAIVAAQRAAESAASSFRVVAQSNQITTLRGQRAKDRAVVVRETWGGLAKILTKLANPALVRLACRETCVTHSLARKIPIVSFVLGLAMGVSRHRNGEDSLKVGAEILSGIAACFPGFGTAISIMIDAVLITVDGRELRLLDNTNIMTFAIATAMLDLDANAERHTEREISRAHRRAMLAIHPDHLQQFGPNVAEQCDQLAAIINEARDFLYSHYGYARECPTNCVNEEPLPIQ